MIVVVVTLALGWGRLGAVNDGRPGRSNARQDAYGCDHRCGICNLDQKRPPREVDFTAFHLYYPFEVPCVTTVLRGSLVCAVLGHCGIVVGRMLRSCKYLAFTAPATL